MGNLKSNTIGILDITYQTVTLLVFFQLLLEQQKLDESVSAGTPTFLAEREASEPPGDGTCSESPEFHLPTASLGKWADGSEVISGVDEPGR